MKSHKGNRLIQDAFISSKNLINDFLYFLIIFSIIYTNNPFYTAGFLMTVVGHYSTAQ